MQQNILNNIPNNISRNISIKTKFIFAVIIVIVSLIIGFYTKLLFFLHLPYYFDWWNLFWYILSWIMLFVAAFFIGKEVLEIADLYIKRKLQETYKTTIDIHKAGIKKGIATTKKGLETTHSIGKKTIAFHRKILGIDELKFHSQKKNRQKKMKRIFKTK